MAARAKQPRRYPDLRYKFIRGLLDYERYQRTKHYMKSAAEWTSKAIVSLDLADEPVKSIPQAKQLEGIGPEVAKQLKYIDSSAITKAEPPVPEKFCSSASALLVAILQGEEEEDNYHEPGNKILVAEEKVLDYAAAICEEKFNAGDLRRRGLTAEIDACRGLVKKRSLKRQPVYELLPPGRVIAKRLRGCRQGQVQRNTPGLPHTVASVWTTEDNAEHTNNLRGIDVNTRHGQTNDKSGLLKTTAHKNMSEEALYTNDTGTEGLVLMVDTQEWGGDRVGLGELIRLLDRTGVRYRTKKLKIADYNWMWRCGGDEIELPIIVERKRADDLARSLKDGRYISQKRKMLDWKESYQQQGVSASLKYLIEGSPEQYAVKCPDGCGAVVKCGFPSVHQLNAKIGELDRDANFDLMKTDGIEGTIDVLTLITAELQQRLEKGDFDILAVQDHTRLDQNENKATFQIEKNESIIEIEDSQETKPPVYEMDSFSAKTIDTRTDPYGISSSQFEADVPLAQYHMGPSKPNYQREEPHRPLDPGEIPGTRGRYVPKEQLHNMLTSQPAHSSGYNNHTGKLYLAIGSPETGGFEETFHSGQQCNIVSDKASAAFARSPQRKNRSDFLPSFEESLEEETVSHVITTHVHVAASSTTNKQNRRKYSSQLATIKTFLSDPDEEQILSLLDLYSGDSNKAVCALLEGHSSNPHKEINTKSKSAQKSTSKRKKNSKSPPYDGTRFKDGFANTGRETNVKATPSLFSPKRLKIMPNDSFLENTDIISGSDSEGDDELWSLKSNSSEARKGKLYRMKTCSEAGTSGKLSPASKCGKVVPVLQEKVPNTLNHSEILMDLPDSLPDLEENSLPILDHLVRNDHTVEGNSRAMSIDDKADKKKALLSKYQEEISQIKALMPHVSNAKIASMVENYKGSVEMAVAALFDEQSQNFNSDEDDN